MKNSFKLVKCGEQHHEGGETVSFGELRDESFCGKVKNSEKLDSKDKDISDSLTTLFSSMGRKGAENGHSISGGVGKSLCTSGDEKGTITQPSEGEYLGYCDNTSRLGKDIDKKVFVEKIKSTGESISLKVCSGTCFSNNNEPTYGFKQGEEKTGEGLEVQFSRKK